MIMLTSEEVFSVVGNGVTALAFYFLTFQLLTFVVHSKLKKLICLLRLSEDCRKRYLFYMLVAVVATISSFLILAGTIHVIHVLMFFFPSGKGFSDAKQVMYILGAAVSVITAILAWKLFPVILDSLGEFEVNSEGLLEHVDKYMVEVVEMVNESILIMSENFQVIRCNQAANVSLGAKDSIGITYTNFIHPADLHLFHAAVNQVMHGFDLDAQSITVEYRVKKCRVVHRASKPLPPKMLTCKLRNTIKVTPGNDTESTSSPRGYLSPQSTGLAIPLSAEVSSNALDSEQRPSPPAAAPGPFISATNEEYVWVEAMICKGVRLHHDGDFVYEIKLVSRNIEDRKREALREYNGLVRENEERERTNAAKLRYISCIAHDLKTPLQSFCFTLDLLNQTNMHREQREFVQQANVAVDLMRLTISQTMDISKALTGAKLMPRRTTVHLSSIMSRVEIIISGYGKQVPVSFEIDQNVSDRIITDEEWLWQMILNLLTNACKYTDRGEIRVVLSRQHGTTHFRHEFEKEMLLVEVMDTGVGVSGDKIGGMFDAFAQVQEGQVTGTGLGLFGVRTRAEGLLGTCGARHNTESSTGTGTVLWFAIPYIPDNTFSGSPRHRIIPDVAYYRTLSAMQHTPDTDDLVCCLLNNSGKFDLANPVEEDYNEVEWLIRRRKLTTIVVDDTKTVCKLMERLLLKMGFASVKCYENGSKGLEAMMAAPVDIVFSDVQMPIMTGPEMVRRFRKFEAEALKSGARETRQLVVAVTANGSELTDSVNNGFDEICPKPLSVQDIYDIVIKFFR